MLPPTPCTVTALRGNSGLTDLMLVDCGIDSTALSHLCEVFANLPALSVLNLSWNKLGTEGARHLGKVDCILSSLFKLPGYHLL